MRKFYGIALAAALVMAVGAVKPAWAATDSSDPIKMPIHNWSSQIVGVYILGKILNEAGYKVEYIPSDS
jgi:glycine betaine/proline transport system substrate-binding protein